MDFDIFQVQHKYQSEFNGQEIQHSLKQDQQQ